MNTHYKKALEGINRLEDMDGPESLEVYLQVMEQLQKEIQTRIETAKSRINGGEK